MSYLGWLEDYGYIMVLPRNEALGYLSNVVFSRKITKNMSVKLLIAISKVDHSYICDYDKIKGRMVDQLERVFAYELYYHWHKLIGNRDYGPKLNAEVFKNFKEWSNRHIMPDMVLHGGQSDDYCQLIVCEIKRKECTNSKMTNDIIRLIKMTNSTSLKYDVGTFIYLGKNEEMKSRIKTGINDYCNKKSSNGISFFKNEDVSRRIICISYDGERLNVITLKELLNENNNNV